MRRLDSRKSMTNFANCTKTYRHKFGDIANSPRAFEDRRVVVNIYFRRSDCRVRIFCRTSRPGRRTVCCLPLSSLKAHRVESCIELSRPSPTDGSLTLWANLRFPTYERKLFNSPPRDTWLMLFQVWFYSSVLFLPFGLKTLAVQSVTLTIT